MSKVSWINMVRSIIAKKPTESPSVEVKSDTPNTVPMEPSSPKASVKIDKKYKVTVWAGSELDKLSCQRQQVCNKTALDEIINARKAVSFFHRLYHTVNYQDCEFPDSAAHGGNHICHPDSQWVGRLQYAIIKVPLHSDTNPGLPRAVIYDWIDHDKLKHDLGNVYPYDYDMIYLCLILDGKTIDYKTPFEDRRKWILPGPSSKTIDDDEILSRIYRILDTPEDMDRIRNVDGTYTMNVLYGKPNEYSIRKIKRTLEVAGWTVISTEQLPELFKISIGTKPIGQEI